MKLKGGCGVHPDNEDWLYTKEADAKICLGCVKDGLFRKDICDSVRALYPQYFTEKKAGT